LSAEQLCQKFEASAAPFLGSASASALSKLARDIRADAPLFGYQSD
jgi:hypothetical protein